MASYVSTVKFTQQGLSAIQETTKRSTAIKTLGKKMGAKVTSVYWTLGAFDGVLIFEAADDETATAFLLAIAAQGNVQTRTARAFTASEMDKILAIGK